MTTYRIKWQAPSGIWRFLLMEEGRGPAFETRSTQRAMDKAWALARDYKRPTRMAARVDDQGSWDDENIILGVVCHDPR